MPRFFIKENQIQNNKITIIGEDVNHIKNVIRKQIGDIIEICNQDNEKSYKCEIEKIEEKQITTKIIEELKAQESNIKVDIFQGLPKAEKMELIIQKSVELGANAIIPVNMKRCVVKLDSKSEEKKIERWQKISESAAKQCGRNNISEVKHLVNIKDICNKIKDYDAMIVAYENEKENTLKRELKSLDKTKQQAIAVVIGPEGGIADKEVQQLEEAGAKSITLGKRILRTETASLVVLSNILYELED